MNDLYLEWLWSVDALHQLEQSTGRPTWLIAGSAAVMFIGWTVCYVLTILKCRRQRTYGFPIVNVAFNVGWEFLFAFDVIGRLPPFYFPLKWGHRLWLVIDLVNVIQVFQYGRSAQTPGWRRDWFYPLAIATFAAATPASYLFIQYTDDVMGVTSALIIDLCLAALFLRFLARRPDLRGISYPAAWARLIGDVSSFVFLFLWWPAQFTNGVLKNVYDVPRYRGVREPSSYVFVEALFVVITLLDLVFIWLVARKRRGLRMQAHAFPAGHPDAGLTASGR